MHKNRNCDIITCCSAISVISFELKKGHRSAWSNSPVLVQTAVRYQKLAPCLQWEKSEESQADRRLWLWRAKGPGREGSGLRGGGKKKPLNPYACLQESPQLPQSPSISESREAVASVRRDPARARAFSQRYQWTHTHSPAQVNTHRCRPDHWEWWTCDPASFCSSCF